MSTACNKGIHKFITHCNLVYPAAALGTLSRNWLTCAPLAPDMPLQDQVSNAVSLPQLPALKELRAALLPHYQVLRKTGTAGGDLVCSATHPLTKASSDAAGARLSGSLHSLGIV